MAAKTSVSLNPEQRAFAESLVEQGRFDSVDAVLEESLELLRREMDYDEEERENLRRLFAHRMAGEFIPFDEFEARVVAMIEKKQGDRV